MSKCALHHVPASRPRGVRREPAHRRRCALPKVCATLCERQGCPGANEASPRKTGLVIGMLRGKAVPIAVHGASTGIPKLCNILRCIAENAVTPKNSVRRCDDG